MKKLGEIKINDTLKIDYTFEDSSLILNVAGEFFAEICCFDSFDEIDFEKVKEYVEETLDEDVHTCKLDSKNFILLLKCEREMEDLFNDCFNECYPEVCFGDLVYQASDVLKSVDPIAFRQEFLNWLDSEGWNEKIGERGQTVYFKEV